MASPARKTGEGIGDAVDPATGIGFSASTASTNRPTPEMLRGIDALVFDIQDVGVHFYTYETTMAYAMEAAAKAGIPYYVLDRPNPITGVRVEGPLLDAANESFVGILRRPARAARHDDGRTGQDLQRRAENRRGAHRDSHGGLESRRLVRRHRSALGESVAQHAQPEGGDAVSGLGMLEYAKNFGGAGNRCAVRADRRRLHRRTRTGGVSESAADSRACACTPRASRPAESNFKGVRIEGVRFEIVNREMLDATRLGLEVAGAIQKLYPGKVDWAVNKQAHRQRRSDPRGCRRATIRARSSRGCRIAWRVSWSCGQKYLLYP